MSIKSGKVTGMDPLLLVADASWVLGAVLWLWIAPSGFLGLVRGIIALAMLVLVPLALRLTDTPLRDGTRSSWYQIAVVGLPVGAISGVISLTMDPGSLAVLVALPWTIATVAIGGFGAWRLLGRGPWPIEELSIDAGLIYIIIGGGALLFDRAGISGAFPSILITLTIVHFHYAGSVLPIIAGIAGRYTLHGKLGTVLRATTGIIIVGPGIIAVGITATAFDVPLAHIIEFTAVAFFTVAVASFSLSVVMGVIPQLQKSSQQILVGGASLIVTISMGFAVLYGLARATGGTYLGIGAQSFGAMVTYHGQLNAYGFAVPALVGWRLAIPSSRAKKPGIQFSRLQAGWWVGENFLERHGMAMETDVSGMVETVKSYACDEFDPDAVAPAVRRFYEHSGEYELEVFPNWEPPWGRLAALYRPIVTRIQQLSVPLISATGDAALTGRVVGTNSQDEQIGDRAWIRSNTNHVTDERQMTFVGVYDCYDGQKRPLLRVVFPLPGGNLTGILRVENGGNNGCALVLSSFPVSGNADDAGLYLVLRGVGMRLPLNETLVVEPSEKDAAVQAAHRVEALGFRLFTLRYDIYLS